MYIYVCRVARHSGLRLKFSVDCLALVEMPLGFFMRLFMPATKRSHFVFKEGSRLLNIELEQETFGDGSMSVKWS